MRLACLHPASRNVPHTAFPIDLVPRRTKHLLRPTGTEYCKSERQCSHAALLRQLGHQRGHITIWHGLVIFSAWLWWQSIADGAAQLTNEQRAILPTKT